MLKNSLVGLLLFGALCSGASFAEESSARGLIRQGTSDGLVVQTINATNGQVEPFGRRFRAGDQIRVLLSPSIDGYVYFINVTPSGERRILYPRGGENNRLTAGRDSLFPSPGETPFVFDNEPGNEIIEIVMTRQPLTALESTRSSSSPVLANASQAGWVPGLASNLGTSRPNQTSGFELASNFRGIGRREDGLVWPPNSLPSDGMVRILLTLPHD